MDPDFDIQIKSLFDQAKTDAPDAAFVHRVMREVRNRERKARLYWLAGLLTVLLFAWVLAPELETLLVNLNGNIDLATAYLAMQLTEFSVSPVFWIFCAPPLAYYLYRNRYRVL